MLICPECLGELAHTVADGGAYWQCAGCHGIILSRAEVERRLGGGFARYFAEQSRASANTHRWPCPLCNNYLAEIRLPHGGGELILGQCPACGAAWFGLAACQAWSASPPAIPTIAASPASAPGPAALETAAAAVANVEVLPPDSLSDIRARAPEPRRPVVITVAPQPDPQEKYAPPSAWWQRIAGYLGFPVTYGERAVAGPPGATLTMAAVIILVSLVALYGTDMEVSVRNLAFYPAQAFRHYGLTLLTCFFLHGGLMHLIGNVYALVIFGENVEGRLGGGFFLLLVLFSTLMGNMLHALFDPHAQIPLIGASGGIAGLITFCCLTYPRMKMGFFWLYRWRKVPAIGFALFWVFNQLLGAYNQVSGEVGISYLCHLGGAAVGVLFWLVCTFGGDERWRATGIQSSG